MTLILLAIALFFLLRRIFSADIRLISTFPDYLLIVVTDLPLITGHFVTHGTVDSILLVWMARFLESRSFAGEPIAPGMGPPRIAKERIPEKYNVQSELFVDFKQGEPNRFDFHLE